MRKSMLLAALVVAACSKEEAPAVDSAATAAPPPAAPAALTAADVSGTWTGTIKGEGDTTVTRFTVVSAVPGDSVGKFVAEGSKDTVTFTTRFDADSMMATSVAYREPNLPKGSPRVMFKSVGRMRDGKLVGNSALVVASKPDSVLSRSTWEATRAP
jgi:hypothetical protein